MFEVKCPTCQKLWQSNECRDHECPECESTRSPAGYAVTDLPMFTCPKCKTESQIDDCYKIETGSTIICQHCESEITVLEKRETIEIRVTA